MFLKNKEKDDRIVERNSLQWLNRKKYIVKGVWKMDYKEKIIQVLEKADERRLKLIYYYVISLFGLK